MEKAVNRGNWITRDKIAVPLKGLKGQTAMAAEIALVNVLIAGLDLQFALGTCRCMHLSNYGKYRDRNQ